MKTEITGRCWTCGNHVTVYQIIAEDHWTMKKLDPEEMGNWVFEDLEQQIRGVPGGFKRLGYQIVVAGTLFGSGSKSVEHPMAALKGAGIRLIIAQSVSRYSYRNAINLALPVLICPDALKRIRRDDEITADILSGTIVNHTTGERIAAQGLGSFASSIISSGGLLNYLSSEVAYGK